MLPSDLVERLKEISNKKGTSLSGYATEALEEALKAEALGSTLDEAVTAYRMKQIHRGAGSISIPRSSLRQLIKNINQSEEEIGAIWDEAGRWYGKYLLANLRPDEITKFLRKDLLTSWNLDEVDITEGKETIIRFTSFMMSEEFTLFLLNYIHGLMESLGYREMEKDSLRGMATIRLYRINKD